VRRGRRSQPNWLVSDHPVCGAKVGFAEILDAAATPPHEEGNYSWRGEQPNPTYFIKYLPIRTASPAENPNTVLYSRLEMYCAKENDPEKRNLKRGKKRGT
jgi:hypothetical protein